MAEASVPSPAAGTTKVSRKKPVDGSATVDSAEGEPRAAREIKTILEAMGVPGHSPQVLPQLLEFAFRM